MNKICFAKSMSNMKRIDVTEKIASGFLNSRRYVTELLHDYCIFFFIFDHISKVWDLRALKKKDTWERKGVRIGEFF